MIVLGIDPSLASTGWALVETAGPRLLASDRITTSARVSRPARLAELSRCIEKYARAYAPDIVAYEGAVSFGHEGARMGGTLAVAEARGAILATIAHSRRIEEVAQATAKKAVTGSGASKKPAVTAAIRALFDNPKLTADECDAAAVALAAGGYSVPAITKPRSKPRTRAARKEATK